MKTDTGRSCVLTWLGVFMGVGVLAPSSVLAQACTPPTAPLDAAADPMNRYIAFQVPSAWAGRTLALRVTLIDLDGFALPPEPTRWVGDPQSFPDEDSSNPDRTFSAAQLACGAVYREWSATEVFYVYGSEVVPGSAYELQAIELGCEEGEDAGYSAPLSIATGKFGDVSPIFDWEGISFQPDKIDIAAVFNKYTADPAAPIKALATLHPNTPDPAHPVSLRDVQMDVDAFVGRQFAALLAGPETCPRRVPQCGDGIVDPGEECDDGNNTPNDGCAPGCFGENATAVIRLVPVTPPAETGLSYPAGVVIDGSSFLLAAGGVRLWFEVRISDWDPDFSGEPILTTWQVQVAAAGLSSGIAGILERPLVSCSSPFGNDPDCIAAFGGPGVCQTGSTWCLGGPNTGAFCSTASDCLGAICSSRCENAYLDFERADVVPTLIKGADASTVSPRFGGALIIQAGVEDDGAEFYGGTLVLDVSEDAAGTFTIGFNPDRRATFLLDASSPGQQHVPIAALESAAVRLGEACCLGLSCTNMLPENCLASGGIPVGVCGGDCNSNGLVDTCEIASGMRSDCNGNDVPDECEPDCNTNGAPDDCDLTTGTSLDCNANDILDECDLTDATSVDCNTNTVPDECDIASSTSGDCNLDGIPDDCQPDADCNGNGVRDICDIGAGTSDDCNFDLVPDDCQPDEDCNANTIRDLCDIGASTELDCNSNLSPDSCDIASGGSFDDNIDGVPDECCQSPTPVFVLERKSRNLSLASVGTVGVRQAIRVTFLENASYPELNLQSLWVGPPREYPEEVSSQPGLTFTGASLSCAPHYREWSAIDVLHVYGAEIVPGSTFAVQLINDGCPEEFPANYSGALSASTGKWGDQSPLFNGPGIPPQPDFNDVAASVQKFRASPGAPIKALAQLQPNVVLPDRPINFKDIAATTGAFTGVRYLDAVPNAGPCACPSAVTCGATVCASDLACGAGFCIDGFCTDACGRCVAP